MNQINNETKLCKKCGKQVPLNRIIEKVNKGVRRQSIICKDCYNAHVTQRRKQANIEKFIQDDSMKMRIHYKEIQPSYILAMEQSGIEPIAEDEIFVKLLDYKDSWISNYGRAVPYYNSRYFLTRKKTNKGGEICYHLNRNKFDGKNWGWRKQVIEAWKLVVKEFTVIMILQIIPPVGTLGTIRKIHTTSTFIRSINTNTRLSVSIMEK